MTRKVVVAAGGTGGHMFPALALVRTLQGRGQEVLLACDARGARYVPAGMAHQEIPAGSPSGSARRRLAGMARLGPGLVRALALLRRERPAAVAAFGGYASVPVGLAAGLLRIPLLVHEQNAILGRANRLIARRAGLLALSFGETQGVGAARRAARRVTGNPVRAEVVARRAEPYRTPLRDGPLAVVVVGGSQGARVLSEVLPAAIAHLPKAERARLRLAQQCRPEDLERVASAYEGLGFEAELATFFEDLPERLARAQLVISRSGASSVAELLVLGRPALLVPYRHAADDHQRVNAEAVARAGAGWVIGEAELDAERLATRLSECLDQPQQLAEMARAAHALGQPDAAAALADALDSLAAPSTAKLPLEAVA
jgi:UDP-N-acetylglucosamine--N-acetylmuramyl-(pentapeptide) pyrophosphoryl-undecaprenol N-acetylglucosamine transferase